MAKIFRAGAIGALLDEYEKAIQELKDVTEAIPNSFLSIIIDPDTLDENCRSVQTILTHVVHAGYGYATSIYNLKGTMERPSKALHDSVKEYAVELTAMFSFTEDILNMFQDNELEQFDDSKKIHSNWGQVYDVEQMIEHAIVHVLRHRRQIERIVYNNKMLS